MAAGFDDRTCPIEDEINQALRDHQTYDKDSFNRLDKRLDKLEDLIAAVAERQQKQVGFIAGVAATVSVIVGVVALVFQWFRG